MTVCFDLGLTLKEGYEKLDRDELTWWLAFYKRRKELEPKPRNKGAGKLPNM